VRLSLTPRTALMSATSPPLPCSWSRLGLPSSETVKTKSVIKDRLQLPVNTMGSAESARRLPYAKGRRLLSDAARDAIPFW
jgi:hypothetical protein